MTTGDFFCALRKKPKTAAMPLFNPRRYAAAPRGTGGRPLDPLPDEKRYVRFA